MSGLDRIAAVANALRRQGLTDIVFVGGSVVELYVTDPAADAPRYTLDVDVVIPVTTRAQFNALESRLRTAGYSQAPGGPICRWEIESILVDVMPADISILGFTNRWYEPLFGHTLRHVLPDGTPIRTPTAPYFLATKLEAYDGRGKQNPVRSHDIEDIILVVDGRPELTEEILNSDAEVRTYLRAGFHGLLDHRDFELSVQANLRPDATSQARVRIILGRFREIATG